MWNKIKTLEYPLLAKYYFSGVFLAVLVFQLITVSLREGRFQLNSLVDSETAKYLIASLIGALGGGYIFVILMIKDKYRETREQNTWLEIKDKNIKLFKLKYIIAYSFSAFITLILYNLRNLLTNESGLLQILFSFENIVEYIGVAFAGIVLGLIISTGMVKRFKILYNN